MKSESAEHFWRPRIRGLYLAPSLGQSRRDSSISDFTRPFSMQRSSTIKTTVICLNETTPESAKRFWARCFRGLCVAPSRHAKSSWDFSIYDLPLDHLGCSRL